MVYRKAMSRAAPTIPVSAKMYRHFAVVTVTITTCLAIFADGENRQALAEEVAARQQQNELRAAEQEKSGTAGRPLFQDKRKAKSSFGPDGGGGELSPGSSDSGYDPYRPVGAEIGLGDSVALAPATTSAAAAAGITPPAKPPPGMTMEEWLALQKQGRVQTAGANPQTAMTQSQREPFHPDAVESVNTPRF